MNLPDIPVSPEVMLNEYVERTTNLTAANVRLVAMVHTVVSQRDAALRRVAELENELRGSERHEEEAFHVGSPPGVQPHAH